MIFWAWLAFSLIVLAAPTKAIPVVPNFQQGVLSSKTTTKTKVNEVINSYEYRTGHTHASAVWFKHRPGYTLL